MKAKQVNEAEPTAWVLVFDAGDEVMAELRRFAKEKALSGSSFTAIGALSRVEVGWFDWEKKDYETAVNLDEQVEVLSLIGDVACDKGEPAVHAHIVIGRRDGTAHGGHLIEGRVRPTLELVLTEWPKHLPKKFDPQAKLPLIAL